MSPGAAWPGAEVSRCDVPQHRVAPRLIGHQPLQPTVLALQLFQPLGLVDPQPPVLPPPAVIRWLGHAEAARDLSRTDSPCASTTSASRSLPMISSAAYRLRAMPTPFAPARILAQDLDRFWGGQVRGPRFPPPRDARPA